MITSTKTGEKIKYVKFPSKFLIRGKEKNDSISALSAMFLKNIKYYALDISEITETTLGEVMVLSAQLEKSTEYGKIFLRRNSLPKSPKIRKLFGSQKKGKIIHLSTNNPNEFEKAKLLLPEIVDSYVLDLKRIGIKEYFYDFNVFLTELIGNAVEHGIKKKNINWWLYHTVNNKNRSVIFTFVDMGFGIVKSHKKAGLPFKYLFLKDSDIVVNSFTGTLQSSTKLSNRGKGLPQLYRMIQNEFVSDLVLITNEVSIYFHKDNLTIGKNTNFAGTYYSWTINYQNYQKWKESLSI